MRVLLRTTEDISSLQRQRSFVQSPINLLGPGDQCCEGNPSASSCRLDRPTLPIGFGHQWKDNKERLF